MCRVVAPLILMLPLLAGCTTFHPRIPFVGQPVAEAVKKLGPPYEVADYQGQGRMFTFSLNYGFHIFVDEPRDPAKWLEPWTRLNSSPPAMAEERYVRLPDYIVWPPYRPNPCTLTLIAQWDQARRTWVTHRTIRQGPEAGRRCGRQSPNIVES